MAKRIVWTAKAAKDKVSILKYWISRNQSSAYSIKLNNLFDEAVEFLSLNPYAGRSTDDNEIRIKVVRDYWLIYTVAEDIIILRVWDVRQNPQDLSL
jgi:plasmid stabilization system protein ParE